MLANIALHGMEEAAASAYATRRKGYTSHPVLIRYADDFVILHRDLAGINAAHAAIARWLSDMGLRLNPTKTRITHTLHHHEGNVGFEFLGFSIRQYPVGKTHAGRKGGKNGARLGFKTHTKPSKDAIQRHGHALSKTLRRHRNAPQGTLIEKLNPQIRGWTFYYRSVVAHAAFAHCDHVLWQRLWRWATRRHPQKSARWVARRYWLLQPGALWQFVDRRDGTVTRRLARHRDTPIKRHIKVRGMASPFDGNLRYWARRLKDHPLTDNTTSRLLARQKGLCPHCGLTFTDGDVREIDHLIPTSQGGNDTLANKQVLHRHCHDQKSARERC